MSNMHIPPDVADRVKMVCGTRTKGGFIRDEIVAKDLDKFVRKELKEKCEDLNLKGKIDEEEFSTIHRVYRQYKSVIIDKNAITRICSEEGLSKKTYPYLNELIYLYLDEFDAVPLTKESSFTQRTIRILRDRVNNHCSMPGCTNKTVVSEPETGKVHYLGKACAIYGLTPGSPRYDPNVKIKFDDVQNAIWLCIYHAQLVNESAGFSADELIKWKKACVKILWDAVQGASGTTLSFNPNENQSKTATEILGFFNNLPALYIETEETLNQAQIACVNTIGDYLLDINVMVMPGTKLQEKIFFIDAGCDAFKEVVAEDSDDASMLVFSFAALKVAIGWALAEAATFYKVPIPENVATITPVYPK